MKIKRPQGGYRAAFMVCLSAECLNSCFLQDAPVACYNLPYRQASFAVDYRDEFSSAHVDESFRERARLSSSMNGWLSRAAW